MNQWLNEKRNRTDKVAACEKTLFSLFLFLLMIMLCCVSAAEEVIPYHQVLQNYDIPCYFGENVDIPVEFSISAGDTANIVIDVPQDGLYEVHVGYHNNTDTYLPTTISVFSGLKWVMLRLFLWCCCCSFMYFPGLRVNCSEKRLEGLRAQRERKVVFSWLLDQRK